MVRGRRFIEIIEEDGLAPHIAAMGDRLVAGLRGIARRTGAFTSPRGRGSLVAVTLPTAEARGKLLNDLFARELIALPSGPTSVRFRLPLIIQAAEIDEILNRVEAAVAARAEPRAHPGDGRAGPPGRGPGPSGRRFAPPPPAVPSLRATADPGGHMAIQDRIAAAAAPFLEPGERVQTAFVAQTASSWWIVLGLLPFLLTNKYRCVVVTDRRILVLDSGKPGLSTKPKSVIRALPRSTRIGPFTGGPVVRHRQPGRDPAHRQALPEGRRRRRRGRRCRRAPAAAPAPGVAGRSPPHPWSRARSSSRRGRPPRRGYGASKR